MLETLVPTKPVVYPVRDGKPLAETDFHAIEISALRELLELYYEQQAGVYVAMNNFVYYEEGNNKKCFAPDVYVVFGVKKMKRDCFKKWEEGGRLPNVVFEMTSRSTRSEDIGKKMLLCESLEIPEYFMFDPKNEYLSPSLQGYRLLDGKYARIEPDSQGRLSSAVLGLDFFVRRPGELGVAEHVSGRILLRAAEYKMIAQREAEARKAAEVEIARLKAELAAKK